ncbi:MAG: cytochrome c [Armatimonadetes bacterium]|nr:cytochrome c [Armatimonadota bacterium]
MRADNRGVARDLPWAGISLAVGLLAGPAAIQGAPAPSGPAALFEKQCYSCHNIGGGDKKGPDLMGVTGRRTREWLHRFILSPLDAKRAGDRVAVDLFRKYAPEEMPDQMLSADQIDQILGLVEQHSKRNKAFVPQSGRLPRPPTFADVGAGYRLFTGRARLSGGAPACASCHAVGNSGGLGGGTLGPDLTRANVKYTDVELAGILKAPAFPTMSRLFANRALTDDEVVQLFAYLRHVKTRTPDAARAGFAYLLLGVAGALAMLGLFSGIWRGRLRSGR